MYKQSFFTALIVISTFVLWPDIISAQGGGAPELEIVTTEDGRVFIYHDQPIPLSHGFHVERQHGGGEWEQLTDKPFYPVQNGYQLQQAMGSRYDRVKGIIDVDDPQSVFLRLRSAGSRSMIMMYAVPDLALNLGHLFIDEEAPVGRRATYRFQIVDDLERRTNLVVEGSAELTPSRPPSPTNLSVENKSRSVTMKWNYPGLGAPESDFVIRFRPRFQIVGRDRIYDATDRIPLRTVNNTSFTYMLTIPNLGETYDFWIEAVDYTGQASPASERVRVHIADNEPPPVMLNINGRTTSDYHAEITWPVSTAMDVAGYHIYRALADQEEFERLTQELLAPLQTNYTDTLTVPGTEYRYAVTAVDRSGNESEKSNSAHVYVLDYTYPDPVTDVRAEFDQNENTISIEWDPAGVYDNLRSYRIIRRQINPPAGRSFSQINQSSFTGTSILDTGLSEEGFREGLTFEYGVAVVNRTGNVSDTVYTKLQIPVYTPPEPPEMVQARMNTNRLVAVSWNASISRDVSHYSVYRTDVEADSVAQLRIVEKGNRLFRDEDVPLNRTYVYSVAAIDSAGNESLQMLADTLVTSRMSPPVAAYNTQAVATEQGVRLSWQLRDNEEYLSGFRIYSASIATGRYEMVGETDMGSLDFTHPEGQPGRWYKVYPVDVTGRQAREAKAAQAVSR